MTSQPRLPLPPDREVDIDGIKDSDRQATPSEFFAPLDAFFGFGLDACAEPWNAKCAEQGKYRDVVALGPMLCNDRGWSDPCSKAIEICIPFPRIGFTHVTKGPQPAGMYHHVLTWWEPGHDGPPRLSFWNWKQQPFEERLRP